jgi:hypothetical protein
MMSGPREFRRNMYGRIPTSKEYVAYLKMKLKQAKEIDSDGDMQWEMARLQGYVNSWPPILDEEGGM